MALSTGYFVLLVGFSSNQSNRKPDFFSEVNDHLQTSKTKKKLLILVE
jgi:hypothetical protein